MSKLSFALNLPSWFSKTAAPCCFKTCHTIHCWKDYLKLVWLVASPKNEWQKTTSKLSSKVTVPGREKIQVQRFYIQYQAKRSNKKTWTRVQVKGPILKGTLSGLRQFLTTENSLKIMKNGRINKKPVQ